MNKHGCLAKGGVLKSNLFICFFTTASILLLGSCSTFFKRTPASLPTQKHYIMTLHGVRGNEASFGDFHYLIKKHLEQIDTTYEVIPINMVYPRGTVDFNTHVSAKAINEKLDSIIVDLKPEDKISIVAYSMGGQVGMTWYYDSLKDPLHKKYPEHVRHFFSLGAAYWGSKEASMSTQFENLFGQKKSDNIYIDTSLESFKKMVSDRYHILSSSYDEKILPKSQISFAELKNLSIASDETNENRISTINSMINQPAPAAKTKWTSLASLVNCFELDVTASQPGCQTFQNKFFENIQLSIFGKYTFGFNRRESDNSVITPSANARFIYSVETDPNYAHRQLTPVTKFNYSIPEVNQEFILTEGLHATVIPASYYEKATAILSQGGETFKDMADDVVLVYKKDCENPQNKLCKHPSYKFILKEFADCDQPNSTCLPQQVEKILNPLFADSTTYDQKTQTALKSELHGFTIELNLRVPKNYDLSEITHKNLFQYIRFNFSDTQTHSIQNLSNSNYTIELAKPDELGSLIINKVTHYSDQNQLRIAMTGLILAKPGQTYDFKSLESGLTVPFTVQLPNLKSRRIEAVIRPYYTTYSDLVMAPYK